MLWWKKKKPKINPELVEVQESIRIASALGTMHICMPINTRNIDIIKDWCTQQGYKIEVDFINKDGAVFYKISGWD